MLNVVYDKCAICKLDLPLGAPVHQKYCCEACATTAAHLRDIARNRKRSLAHLDEKRNRPPCLHCGRAIPAEAKGFKRYCCDDCRAAAYAPRWKEIAKVQNATKSAALLAAKQDRPPCVHCGKPIPASASFNRIYCGHACKSRARARK